MEFCTIGMHYMRDVTIFTGNKTLSPRTYSGIGWKWYTLPSVFTFLPFLLFSNPNPFFYLHYIPTSFIFPYIFKFLSSSLFDKIFSIFWSDQLFNPTSLNFSFFIFQIFEYTLHNEVTREFSSFFFLRTLIKVKNQGQ